MIQFGGDEHNSSNASDSKVLAPPNSYCYNPTLFKNPENGEKYLKIHNFFT